MKKQYKSSRIKNHKNYQKKKKEYDWVPLKGNVASLSYFSDLAPEIKKSVVGISSDY